MSFVQTSLGMAFTPPVRAVRSFPSARLRSSYGALPVEVSLIAQLGHGARSHLFAGVMARQSAHHNFIDALDEPSARIGDTDFSKGDATSLYMFAVGTNGHPFHRHAGHRVFTAISGSGGTRLRFASVTDTEMERDPSSFMAAMRCVEIPPDCLFTVRFAGETWHQFTPLQKASRHPALFAISCHTNELSGSLPDTLKQQVLSNQANIPSLTELLPASVMKMLQQLPLDKANVPTIALALDAPVGSVHSAICRVVRSSAGWLRGQWARCRRTAGYLWDSGPAVDVLDQAPQHSLLREQLNDGPIHHEDTFRVCVIDASLSRTGSQALLARLLEGFVESPPTSVSYLMALRNAMVKPIGLRMSPLGCPVSSLLSPQSEAVFAGRFPVRQQQYDAFDRHHQVILGTNDKHLMFRSCASVDVTGDRIEFTLGTRVRCKNAFGHVYMGMIDRVHRRHVSPAILRHAVQHVLRTEQGI
jgi:Protein of unknown function (DUF2867)